MYAYFKKLDYFSTECTYSLFAARGCALRSLWDVQHSRTCSYACGPCGHIKTDLIPQYCLVHSSPAEVRQQQACVTQCARK